jgi:ATP-dependent Lhr-like helicase
MAMAFELLGPQVGSLLAAEGLEQPTDIQREGIPRVAAGEDVLLIAPTGSGKTEAALLPVLAALARRERVGIGCLYITPLRALNRDVERRLRTWAANLGMRVEVRHGDTAQKDRRRQALKPPDLLVTTPETLQAILPAKVMRRHLSHVRHVIVDEVHQLAKDRRGIQLAVALERLREVAGPFQRIGISATVAQPERIAALFGGARPMQVVQVRPPKDMQYRVAWPKPTDEDAELARELFIGAETAASLSLLRDEIEAHTGSLVFVNSRSNAELLGSRLPLVTEGVGVHHGSLPREAREKAEQDFKAGALKALVCTSTLELGIDVGSVDHVLQYMSPRRATNLVQRTGRAGHAPGRTSKGTIIAIHADDVLESLAVIRHAQRGDLEPPTLHEGSLDVLGHQLVGLALDGGGRVALPRALALLRRAGPYRQLGEAQAEKVAGFLAHLRFLREEGSSLVATARGREYYFRNLSTIKDERTYPVIDLTSMKPVGILGEEEFVLRARKGYSFIVRGRTWKIHDIGADGRVYVDPVEDLTARIAGWQGELMAVPFGIAQETAQLRTELATRLGGRSIDEVLDELQGWPVHRPALRRVAEVVQRHLATGAPVPSDRTVMFEAFDKFLLVHAPYGEVVNECLGDLLEELLARKNLVRYYWTDPHRILLELTVPAQDLDLPALAKELLTHDDDGIEKLLDVFLKEHLPIGFYMKPIAERLGALARGLMVPADELNSFEVRFKGTPIEDEAYREIAVEHVDFDGVRKVFRGVREGTIQLQFWKAQVPTPLGYPIVRRYVEMAELLSPEQDREQNVERMRQFLQAERVGLLCFQCGSLRQDQPVADMPEHPECPTCGSRILGALSWHGLPLRDALARRRAGEPLGEEEEKELVRLRQGADLVAVYGRKAVMALSVYGIGAQTAGRILAKMHRDDQPLFRDLYEAKLRYIQTKPYWDRDRRPREAAGKAYAYNSRGM